MNVFLRVKQNSLAAEAKIIRHERRLARARARSARAKSEGSVQHKLWADGHYSTLTRLTEHHRNIVRKEARATHLAQNFLRGTPYRKVEAKCYEAPQWDKVGSMLVRYGGVDSRVILQRLTEWMEASEPQKVV